MNIRFTQEGKYLLLILEPTSEVECFIFTQFNQDAQILRASMEPNPDPTSPRLEVRKEIR